MKDKFAIAVAIVPDKELKRLDAPFHEGVDNPRPVKIHYADDKVIRIDVQFFDIDNVDEIKRMLDKYLDSYNRSVLNGESNEQKE